MLRIFSFTAVFCFITLSAFGQETRTINTERFGISRLNERTIREKQSDDSYRPEEFSPKVKNPHYHSMLKSSDPDKQRLDSIIYNKRDKTSSLLVVEEKEESTYDGNGNLTQYISYYWRELMWVEAEKEEYTYDANGNLTLLIHYFWAKSLSQWVVNWERESTYNVNGNQIQYITFAWKDPNYPWVDYDSKYKSTYDTNGNERQYITSEWDNASGQWVVIWKRESTYDANGSLSQLIYYVWTENSNHRVEYKSKYETTYDANGNQTQYIIYEWNETTSQWVESVKKDFTYDANGNQTQCFTYDWNETSSQWLEKYKVENIYDANGNQTQYITYDWYKTSSQWMANYKEESTYDANGNQTQYITYEWYETLNRWVADYKEESTFDLLCVLSDLIFPTNDWFYNNKIVNKPLEYLNYYWHEASGEWNLNYKGIYYYSEDNISSVDILETSIINLYPNPVLENLTINISGNYNHIIFELFDLQGRRLVSKIINNSEVINMADLKTGIYFYNLFMDSKKQSGKIVKE